MQILRKPPAFEMLLLCFPSKHFLLHQPPPAPTSSPTPAGTPNFAQCQFVGCNYPSCCLGAKATSEAPIPYACFCQKLFMPWLPHPHCSRVLAGTSVHQPHLIDTHTGCTIHQVCPVPTDVLQITDPGPALTLLWGDM